MMSRTSFVRAAIGENYVRVNERFFRIEKRREEGLCNSNAFAIFCKYLSNSQILIIVHGDNLEDACVISGVGC
jgi:hypothetical protein